VCPPSAAQAAAGADLNWTSNNGRTALHWSVMANKHLSVERLMNLGADATICDAPPACAPVVPASKLAEQRGASINQSINQSMHRSLSSAVRDRHCPATPSRPAASAAHLSGHRPSRHAIAPSIH